MSEQRVARGHAVAAHLIREAVQADEVDLGTVFIVRSSKGTSFYDVRPFIAPDDENEVCFSCTCQAWKFQKQEIQLRECKHTHEVELALIQAGLGNRYNDAMYWRAPGRPETEQYETVLLGTFEFPDDLPDWA